MDAREQKGRTIAETSRIIKQGGKYLVPSQSGKGRYSVVLNAESSSCSCPDHEVRGVRCKHIHAALFFTMRKTERNADGSTTVSEVTVAVKKTYAQPDWPAYHASQVNELTHFRDLLAELCAALPEPTPKPGKPAMRQADAAFAAVLKVYSGLSTRRFMGQLEEAHARGYLSRLPHYNSIIKFLDGTAATEILHGFIARSCVPLAGIEDTFAVDSTGFSTLRYASWFDKRYGVTREEAQFVKTHACVGVVTNVITACVIEDQNAADSPQLPKLIKATAQGFKIAEVSGDKAYAATTNFEAVNAVGGTFYPAFRSNTTGAVGGLFEKAFHLFCLNRDKYLKHYHRRSNAESTFSAVKRKFGDMVRSKTDVSMRNEVLAKVVAHNLTCVINAWYEMGIEPSLAKREETEPPMILKFQSRV